jgi:hypothetical protein
VLGTGRQHRYSWGVWVVVVAQGGRRYTVHAAATRSGFIAIDRVLKIGGKGRNMSRGASRRAIEEAAREAVRRFEDTRATSVRTVAHTPEGRMTFDGDDVAMGIYCGEVRGWTQHAYELSRWERA